MQVPLEQVAFWTNGRPVQLTQFDPQAEASVIGSTQAPPQTVVPPGQTHVPSTHVAPVGHACPQAPQLAASEVRVTHDPLQSVMPAGHAEEHCPLAHTSPDAQA